MKDNFFAGLRIVLPIVLFVIIICWTVGALFDVVEFILQLFPRSTLESLNLPEWVIKVLGVCLLCIIILCVGIVSQRPAASEKFKRWLEPVVYRIPLLSHLFKITNQVANTLRDTESFKRVVLVHWPHEKAWALGFITNENPPFSDYLNDLDIVSVVVPAAPLTSYWPLMMSRKDIIETDIPVSSAISFIVSLGVAGATNEVIKESHPYFEGDFFNCFFK